MSKDKTELMPQPYQGQTTRVIDVVQEPKRSGATINITDQAKEMQAATAASAGRTMRRMFFIWFRVFVYETKRGKGQKVNVAIPIPIPFVGTLFSRHLSFSQAVHASTDPGLTGNAEALEAYLQSCMGLEFVRVEESQPERGRHQLVVVGFD